MRTRHLLAAAGLAMLAVPANLGVANADAAVQTRNNLPPGVVQLNDGEACPQGTLCLYQHYGRRGPAYGIGAGYTVHLKDLPMGNGTAANNVSSWVNNTASLAELVDTDNDNTRPLFPGQSLEEPSSTNDTVDVVCWN